MNTEMTQNLDSGLAGAYRTRLAWQHENIEFVGMSHYKDEAPLSLTEIYVPLGLFWKSPNLQDAEQAGMERLYIPEALETSPHLVVLGDPGAGKSTLTKFLIYSFARLQPTPLARRFGPRIPVPILLRDYDLRDWSKPEDMLQAYVDRLEADLQAEVSVEWLMEALQSGKGILLLDGLDEVGSPDLRKKLRDSVILPLLESMPASFAILTSRIVGYEEASLRHRQSDLTPNEGESGRTVIPRLRECYVAPFNDDERQQFVRQWYAARERDDRERERNISSLSAAINQDRIKRLAGNPTLLTMMALIHRVRAELPSGRVKLYDKIAETYLETLQGYRRLPGYSASLDQMKRWLAKIGYEMQKARSHPDAVNNDGSGLLVSRNVLLEWLEGSIRVERPDEPRLEAEQFLDYVARRSGLLLPRGPDFYAFAHLTFQEYFAAWHLRGQLRRFQDLTQECGERVADTNWHETLQLLVEMLSEFPGTGDDLTAALRTARPERDPASVTTALFLAELLNDDQSGISYAEALRCLRFALSVSSQSYDYQLAANVSELDSSYDAAKREWASDRFQMPPDTIGETFFVVGPAFLRAEDENWWTDSVRSYIQTWSQTPWTPDLVESAVAASDGSTSVLKWAVDQLPYQNWFRDFEGVCLADAFYPGLYSCRHTSAVHELVTMLAGGFVVSELAFVRIAAALYGFELASESHDLEDSLQFQFQSRSRSQSQSRSLSLSLYWSLSRSLALSRSLSLSLHLYWSRPRSLSRSRSLSLSLHLYWPLSLSLSRSLSDADQPEPDWIKQGNADISQELADSEWLFGAPSASDKVYSSHIAKLRKGLGGEDDWSNLLRLTALLVLGESDMREVRERNRLIDKGIRSPRQFTFPGIVGEVVRESSFLEELPALMRIIFQPSDGPLVREEWLDPHNEISKYFTSRPREFYPLAAAAFDPKGETGLSKWLDRPPRQ